MKPEKDYFRKLAANPEFQSSVMRLLAWIVMVGLLTFGRIQGYFDFDWQIYWLLFPIHLSWGILLLVHIILVPKLSRTRQILGGLSDVTGTTICIYLDGSVISPFFLLYFWAFISQGSRFGRINLMVALATSLISFLLVATALDEWHLHPVHLVVMLLMMFILPFYQIMLIRKISDALVEARRANKARADFLAVVSHEVRTPLTDIIGMTSLLSNTRLNYEQQSYLDNIETSASHMNSILGDILDLSKIDAGKLSLKPVYFDLCSTLEDLSRGAAIQTAEKKVEVVCSISPDLPKQVYGDELRLRQILANLMRNAVKYTDRGIISIEASVIKSDENPRVQILVADSGIGMAEQDITSAYQRYWRKDGEENLHHDGTGLGMAIARDLCRLMEGEIRIESQIGRGTRVFIELPLLNGQKPLDQENAPDILREKQVLLWDLNPRSNQVVKQACAQAGIKVHDISNLEADRIMDSASEVFQQQVNGIIVVDNFDKPDIVQIAYNIRDRLSISAPLVLVTYAGRYQQLNEKNTSVLIKPFCPRHLWEKLHIYFSPSSILQTETDTPKSLTPVDYNLFLNVLVAEDNRINALLLKTLLANAGYNVRMAGTGTQALEYALHEDFDIALIDLFMPEMDGFDFIRTYRRQEDEDTHLPVIALSADATFKTRQQCLDAGMDEFLLKPVYPDKLDILLQRFIQS